MSHLRERKEKNCLNCGTHIYGKYCHICGQENIEPKESLWHLITHFFNDVTHFDGKFFSSLKYLLTRPGVLSKHYMAGKRASYLNPVRMYIFTSAIFFILFFSILKPEIIGVNSTIWSDDDFALDSGSVKNSGSIDKAKNPPAGIEFNKRADTISPIAISSSTYASKEEYDSVLKAGAIKDNWFKRQMIYKSIEVNAGYKNNPKGFLTLFGDTLLHTFPQMFFVSLPLFALMLKLLYVRRKQYYYTDHLIFSLHTYIFIFIALMAILGFNKIEASLHWNWLKYVNTAVEVAILLYFYKALRNFYNQGRIKTVLKLFLILLLLMIIVILLFTFFLFLSFFQL